jgi:hypothetical protein
MVNVLDLRTLNYSELVKRADDSLNNVKLGCSSSESLSRAFRKGRKLYFLFMLCLIVFSWLLGLLCRVVSCFGR